MALPTVAINSAGSDTLASGAGPAVALNGSLAATHTNTTVNITDVVDLSGVAVDGSAVLWVSSSSGKQWSKITTIAGSSGAWVVTVADAYANTESGKSWAIGGKRLSLNGSIQLGLDMRSGWVIDVQTDQVLTSTFRLTPNAVNNQWSSFTSTSVTRPIISTSTNSVSPCDLQGANQLIVSHLSLLNTAGTPADGIALASFSSAATAVLVDDCVVDGFRNGIMDHDSGGNADVFAMVITNCEVKNCTTFGVNLWAGANVEGCKIHDNLGAGLNLLGTRARAVSVVDTVIYGNVGIDCDVALVAQTSALFRNVNFTGATAGVSAGFGLRLNTANNTNTVRVDNCIFYGNAKYGLYNANLIGVLSVSNCAFGNNVTADVFGTGVTTGTNPITLTANPFVSATDFALNSTAGGGAACKGAGISQSLLSASATAPDVGAVQRGSSGSSGGSSSNLVL